jgi:hypothetical protein
MRPSSRLSVALALACAVGLGGCDNTATVSFTTGELELAISASSIALPTELREDDPAGPKVRRVPCGPTTACPSSEEVVIACEAMTCDPAPTVVSVPLGDVVDFETTGSDRSTLLRELDSIEIREIRHRVVLNTLSVDVEEVRLFWAPEGASTGETRFGVVPPIPARATDSGVVALDAAGNAALSDHLVSASRRVRFFAETTVDLAPGGPFPEGELALAVEMSVTASGPLLD